MRRRERSGRATSADDEIVAQLRVILFGAIETVESTVVNAVLLLLSTPTSSQLVRAEPDCLGERDRGGHAADPARRLHRALDARSPELGDVELGAGEFVGVCTLAANRDPAVFADPGAVRRARANARHHLSLSSRRHHCLGFNLARLQGAVATAAILKRLRHLALVEAPEPHGLRVPGDPPRSPFAGNRKAENGVRAATAAPRPITSRRASARRRDHVVREEEFVRVDRRPDLA